MKTERLMSLQRQTQSCTIITGILQCHRKSLTDSQEPCLLLRIAISLKPESQLRPISEKSTLLQLWIGLGPQSLLNLRDHADPATLSQLTQFLREPVRSTKVIVHKMLNFLINSQLTVSVLGDHHTGLMDVMEVLSSEFGTGTKTTELLLSPSTLTLREEMV